MNKKEEEERRGREKKRETDKGENKQEKDNVRQVSVRLPVGSYLSKIKKQELRGQLTSVAEFSVSLQSVKMAAEPLILTVATPPSLALF